VRRNRRRFWKAEDDADKHTAYLTLYTCLTALARLMAPFTPFLSDAMYRNLVAEQDSSAPESVHLAGWPEVREEMIDERLLADTALLLQVVSLGRSARQAAGVRVRQPLSELLVSSPAGIEGLQRFETELREELNVKAIRYLDVDQPLVQYRLLPNLPVVGRKYRQMVPAIREALSRLAPEEATAVARAAEGGRPFQLVVNGQAMDLEPNDVLVHATSPEGYEVAAENRLLVALNTSITSELRMEGQARDLVRFVQDARKAAGFEISDRISLALQPEGDLDVDRLVELYGDYIKAETLANSLAVAPPEEGAHVVRADLEGSRLTVGVRRAHQAR
jgi:isoleucyl-tRNA synthetase